jgi:hypothetical protein
LVILRHDRLERWVFWGVGISRLGKRQGGEKSGNAGGKEQFHGMISVWTFRIVMQVLYPTLVKMNRKSCKKGSLVDF